MEFLFVIIKQARKYINTGTMVSVLVECRRLVSLLFVPWVSAVLICILLSWYSVFVIGLDALLAPVLKTWLLLKPFLIYVYKGGVAVLLWVWVQTIVKFSGWIGEMFMLVVGYLGGWKAWSFKKMLRQGGRFIVTFSARFVLFSVILNLLFGRERKGVKRIPALLLTQLKRSIFGRLISWWGSRTERQKRLVFGIILCIALVITGHALLGFSILLFDLLWELVLILARWMLRLWRLLLPVILRFLPNAVLNFVSTKLLPFFADIVPIVRDDHRVMYLRFNVQRHYRNLKAYLYRKSRSKRSEVRVSVRPFIGQQIRKKKSDLIEAATSHSDKDETGSNRSDGS